MRSISHDPDSNGDDAFVTLSDVMFFMFMISLLLLCIVKQDASEIPPHPSEGGQSETNVVIPPIPPTGPEDEEKGNTIRASGAKGLAIKFASRADLFSLIQDGAVNLYCVVSGDEFQLIFQGEIVQDKLNFNFERTLPSASWKVNDPVEVDSFMSKLEEFDPTIKTYSDRQVLIVFKNQDLADHFKTKLEDLKARKASGALLITADRKVKVILTEYTGSSVK